MFGRPTSASTGFTAQRAAILPLCVCTTRRRRRRRHAAAAHFVASDEGAGIAREEVHVALQVAGPPSPMACGCDSCRLASSVWKQDKLAHRQLRAPQPVGELVAVGDFEGYVHFLARETGAFVARYATDGGPVRAAPRPIPAACWCRRRAALHALAP